MITSIIIVKYIELSKSKVGFVCPNIMLVIIMAILIVKAMSIMIIIRLVISP